MSNEELKYLFSDSACLTSKQMKSYVRGSMANDESYAVELHLNSCPFCNEAIEGLFEQVEGSAAEAVTQLNSNFLKDHFSLHHPQVHLNSMAPAQPVAHVQPRRRRRINGQSAWKPSSIAAILLLGLGVIWFAKQRQRLNDGQAANMPAEVVEHASKGATPVASERAIASADLVQVKDEALPQQLAAAETGSQSQQLSQPIAADKELKQANQQQPAPATVKPVATADEPVITQYKAPLIDKSSDTRPKENIEKMPGRTTSDIAATAAGASRGGDDDGADLNSRKLSEANTPVSADDLYSQKKYSAALNAYQEQMKEGSRGKRNYATLQAARCYLAMGNKQSAITLLQLIVEQGGAHKRTAKRLLEDLGADKGE